MRWLMRLGKCETSFFSMSTRMLLDDWQVSGYAYFAFLGQKPDLATQRSHLANQSAEG